MGPYKFALKMLKADYKKCIFYIASMIFSTVVIFNFFNIVFNGNFIMEQTQDGVVFKMLALGIIIISILFVFFANSYFISSKAKEIAVSTLSGINIYKLSQLLLYQNFVIIAIALPLGILLGVAIMPFFAAIMYKVLGASGNLWAFSRQGLLCTICVIVMQIIFLALVNAGHVYKTEIKDLMTIEKQVYEPDRRKHKIPKVIYLILYLFPIILILVKIPKNEMSITVSNAMYLGIVGVLGTIQFYIPQRILELKNKKFISKKLELISISNLHHSLKKSKMLVLILSGASISLIVYICLFRESPRMLTMGIFSYVSVVLLMAICIIYKFAIEAMNRRTSFKQLRLIGYTHDQINSIIKQEVGMFYAIVIGIPLFHMLILFIAHLKVGLISPALSGELLAVFIVTFGITAAASYAIYKKSIFNYLKLT